ncbi:citrate lyase holo-[acyl-carrier protein] synthase [Affinibrenneria salicis]|uniref:Apo-citrate lyase phosphoribosyl-dephospho-CoA transferase n=1 Tax=Affinibrenneria salicis TaxID=2590031 RepID=A0A5J5FY31_9GAMM|nr:citrate lyase holo-[acyl-carrier protein] synthase [Affinibrenneria salicis]KAA8999025.1 citrate lyase holo-[acyl-carrier protein] synthase [Affinibrenneria salicis]
MATTTPAAAGVSLEELLAAKERRAHRQSAWLTRFSRPLISLTLVTPGAVKDSARYRRVMDEAVRCADALLLQRGWPRLKQQTFWLPTGAEAFWCVGQAARQIKAATIELEQSHPLGRLWDFDVICPQAGVVGRRALDHAGRRCLICDAPAHQCARSRRHPLPGVIAKVEELIDGWLSAH